MRLVREGRDRHSVVVAGRLSAARGTQGSGEESGMSAVISDCGRYRYRLDRQVALSGPVYAFFGVNPSTADATVDDATVRKWIGFSKRWGAGRFIVGNVFAYRATDVRTLATVEDPFGPDIGEHVSRIIAEADVLVPCWGCTDKVPPGLRFAFDVLLDQLLCAGRPVKAFGFTAGDDPKHPLMLGYDTQLVPLLREVAA
jgi:hypothetical protein